MAHMDENIDATTDAAAPPSLPAPPPPRRRGPWPALVLLLIVLAAAWFGWQWFANWQARSAAGNAQQLAQQQSLAHLQQQMDSFGDAVDALGKQRSALRDRLTDSEAGNRRLQDQVAALNQRVEQLEAAVTRLSQHRLSGHDAMLLDDAEMLLQLADQRYGVLHDAQGAQAALTQAAQALAGIDDVAFAGLRQNVDNARRALAASHPDTRRADLDAIERLRAAWPMLPQKPLDQPATAAPASAWQRAWRALSDLVRIRRDSTASDGLDDARLAQQLAVLDLARAEAALLDHDDTAAHAALERVLHVLDTRLDRRDAGVQSARVQLSQLLATANTSATPAPQLDEVLSELRNLRGVHELAPAAAATVPAVAGSAP
jgi:uroporphyrin-3 C-methyltransferase